MTWIDGVGLTGVALIIIAYLLLQMGRVTARSPVYSAGNALGAALVLFTLVFDFNLSAAIVEGFWLVISLYGLWRVRRAPKATPAE